MVVVIMEGKHHSPHLKKVLKSYQLTAANTLSGPSSVLSRFNNNGSDSTSSSSSSSSNSSSPAGNIISNVNIMERPYQASIMIKPEPGSLKSACESPGSGFDSNNCSSSLLHQQLKLKSLGPVSSPKAATTPFCLGPVKKEFLTREDSPPTTTSSSSTTPSSFVQVRRSSGGAVEITSRGNQGDSQIRTAFINRSKSSPGNSTSSGGVIGSVSHSNLIIVGGSNSNSCSNLLPAASASLKSHLVSHTASSNINGVGPGSMKIPIHAADSLKSPTLLGGIGPRGGNNINHSVSSSSSSIVVRDPFSVPQLPPPILSAPDQSWTEKKETLLENECISCFVVGGEKRLCFPQILTSVLRGFQLHQINQVCDELQIFCSRCSNEQLEVLKMCGIIPMNAPSCGLITKTDAERLVNALLHRNPPKSAISTPLQSPKDSKSHIRVYHNCFGKAKGIASLQLYISPDALCIECEACHGLFSPARFVAHSHDRSENRTCHWGFDTANWRHYLLLNKKHEDSSREAILKDFKAKYDHKRKESRASPMDDLDDYVVRPKKVRCDPPTSSPSYVRSPSSFLPSTKIPQSSLQHSPNEQHSGINLAEMERVKKMLLVRLGPEDGEEVNVLLDKMTKKISSLEQVCRRQAKYIEEVSPVKTGVELQTKVNTMEAELQSLKKQLLRRHVQSEEI